ncbi:MULTISPECIES: DUF6286 domain-containing protein [unclassified Streptomyces]|uniref:DUF6286 domain-containing protein n=1 Tax=unclassified Streptomyces TaxID=2593676 RepID=UPI00381F341C
MTRATTSTTAPVPVPVPVPGAVAPAARTSPSGTLRVSEKAVRRIVERTASEALPPGSTVTRATARVRGGRARTGVRIALTVTPGPTKLTTVGEPDPTPPPGHAPATGPVRATGSVTAAVRAVQDRVSSRTELLTGLRVPRPGVEVTALRLPGRTPPTVRAPAPTVPAPRPALSERPTPAGRRGPRVPRRWWSPRRVPSAVLALAVALASGATAADELGVRMAGGRPAAWRTGLLDRFAGYGPGDPELVLPALLTAGTGLLLIALAVLPGRRRLWPVSAAPGLVSAVDRNLVAALVREAVAATPGVTRVRVRARRRRVTVRARLLHGDPSATTLAAEAAAATAITACCPHRPPRSRVRLRPDDLWVPDGPYGPEHTNRPNRPVPTVRTDTGETARPRGAVR